VGLISKFFGSPFETAQADPTPPVIQIENALTNDGEGWDSFYDFVGGEHTRGIGGVKVTQTQALQLGAVNQALRTISGDIACCTLQMHDNTVALGQPSVKSNHPSHHVCAIRWRRYQAAFECWRRMVIHALLWGDGYAYINRDSRGRIQWMGNLRPGTVRADTHCFTEGQPEIPVYMIHMEDGDPYPALESEIFHLRGAINLDQCESEDPIRMMRDTLSVTLGAQRFQGSFFSSGAQAGGIVSIPPGVPTAARERLEEQIQKKSNAENWFKTMVLRDGAQWHQTTVDSKSSEMIATMEAVVRDVARFFNLPPFKLGIGDSVSYNSVEIGQQVYLTNCLNPWFKAIQCEAHLKFLPDNEQLSGNYRFEHNTSKLLEPDFKTLNEVLAIQRQNEIINANDWLAKINLPLRSDPEALLYVNPNTKSNMQTADAADNDSTTDTQPDEEKGGTKTDGADSRNRTQTKLLNEAIDRVNRRICAPVCNRSKRPTDLLSWLDSEGKEHRTIITEELSTTLELIYGSEAENKLKAVEAEYFAELTSVVRPFTEHPYKETSLIENVQNATSTFTQRIFSHLTETIL
jgi:HK97 family phage portal protein